MSMHKLTFDHIIMLALIKTIIHFNHTKLLFKLFILLTKKIPTHKINQFTKSQFKHNLQILFNIILLYIKKNLIIK